MPPTLPARTQNQFGPLTLAIKDAPSEFGLGRWHRDPIAADATRDETRMDARMDKKRKLLRACLRVEADSNTSH
jgi:hypothetical protein